MKVILISEALEEPFEMDSGEDHDDAFWFPDHVMEKVLETEKMRASHERHGIFGRG